MTHNHQQLFLSIAGRQYFVTHFHCKNDAISSNYFCELSFTSAEFLDYPLGEKICLIIKNKRYLHGILYKWIYNGKKLGIYSYKIHFFSLMNTLAQLNSKNYAHQTIPNILQTLLKKNNINDCELHLTKSYSMINFLAQYQKSDLLIFENLLKEHRIFYIWEQKNDKPTLHLSDDKSMLSSLFKACLLSYKPFNTGIDNDEVIFEKSYSKLINGNERYFFKTNCCMLYPGQILHLSAQEAIYNKSFRIINIEHFGEQLSDNIHAEQQQLIYQNHIACINFSEDFIKNPKKQKTLRTLTAHTAQENHNTLDDNGNYYLKFSYDTNTTTPAFNRTQDFNGNQIAGMHFPLKTDTLVLTGFINDDINTPIILGQIPSPAQASPVTDKNPYQYIMRTAEQSELIFDDKGKSISLQNKNNIAQLDQQGIDLKSKNGNLCIHSEKNYSLNTGLDYVIQAKINYQQTCYQASFLSTKDGDIELKATDNLNITAKESLKLQSNKIQIEAKDAVKIFATHQYLKISNSFTAAASESLSHITAKTKMQATREFSINQNISLQANFLKISAETLKIISDEIRVYQDSQIN